MFVTPAYAQTAGAAGGGEFLVSLLPFVAIFAIMYLLIIRPQRKAAADRATMLSNVRRNDTVVTGGGVIGKVLKVHDEQGELEVEIAAGTKVRLLRSMVAEVRVKGEPVAAKDGAKGKSSASSKSAAK